MKKIAALALMSTFLLTAARVGPIEGQQESRYMSRAFGANKGYDVQVSTVLTEYNRDQAYMPLIVQVHNWYLDRVRVSLDQFSLVGSDGRIVKPITSVEFLQNHRLQGRRNLAYLKHRADSGILTKPHIWYIERSRFYPLGGNAEPVGGPYENINLRANHFLLDWLYFPRQEPGVYRLIYSGDDGEQLSLPISL